MRGWIGLLFVAVLPAVAVDFSELGEKEIKPEREKMLSPREYDISLKLKALPSEAEAVERVVMSFARKAVLTVAVVKPAEHCSPSRGYCILNEVFCPVDEIRKSLPRPTYHSGTINFVSSFLRELRNLGWEINIKDLATCDGEFIYRTDEYSETVIFKQGKAIVYKKLRKDVLTEIFRYDRGNYKIVVRSERGDYIEAYLRTFSDKAFFSIVNVRINSKEHQELKKLLEVAYKTSGSRNPVYFLEAFISEPDKYLANLYSTH